MRRDYDALRLANGVAWSATRYIRKRSPYKALEKFSKAVYGTTGGTCSARDFRPVMSRGAAESNSSFLSALQTSQVHP